MRDFFCRFPDRATFQALDLQPNPELAIDEIGTWEEVLSAAVLDLNGNELQAEVRGPLPGFHVNIRVLDSRRIGPILAPFIVEPSSPIRDWL